MKRALTPLILVLAVLACGCTAASPASTAPVPSATPAAPATPEITGTWTGTTQGYEDGTGFTDYAGATVSLVVDEQHGRIFSGHLLFKANGTTELTKDFAGAIGHDGRTLTIAEKGGGFSSGSIVSPGEIELIYLHDSPSYGIAVDSLKKV